MWYIFGQPWQRAPARSGARAVLQDRLCHLEHGMDWRRDGKEIIPPSLEHECQALPTVFFRNGQYHMYFCYRNAFDFRHNASMPTGLDTRPRQICANGSATMGRPAST